MKQFEHMTFVLDGPLYLKKYTRCSRPVVRVGDFELGHYLVKHLDTFTGSAPIGQCRLTFEFFGFGSHEEKADGMGEPGIATEGA